MTIRVLVVRRETEKAVQLILDTYETHGRNLIVWMPKSVIEREVHAGDRGVVIEMPEWAQDKLEIQGLNDDD